VLKRIRPNAIAAVLMWAAVVTLIAMAWAQLRIARALEHLSAQAVMRPAAALVPTDAMTGADAAGRGAVSGLGGELQPLLWWTYAPDGPELGRAYAALGK